MLETTGPPCAGAGGKGGGKVGSVCASTDCAAEQAKYARFFNLAQRGNVTGMAKTVAERVRKHRERKRQAQISVVATVAEARVRAAPEGGLDAVRKLFDAAVQDPESGGMTLEAMARTALTLEKAELEVRKRRRDADELVESEVVRGCWNDAMTSMKTTLLCLPETLAAELAGVSDEGAVRRILAGQVEAALGELQRSPATWPVAVGPWESER